MTVDDQPPPDVQEAARKVQAWVDRPKPEPQSQPQPQLNATERFKATVRADDPPLMPAWDRALAGNSQPQPGERAGERFLRQRLDRPDKPLPMPEWRDPRGAA
jgi:hypothetical protein